jgi:hypothetical protein
MIYNAQNTMPKPTGEFRKSIVSKLLSEGDGSRDEKEVNEMIDITHEMYLIRMSNDIPHILAYKFSYTAFLGV